MTTLQALLKRTLDLVAATSSIIFLLPVMAVLALVILLREGRPIIHAERRMGRHNQLFTLYKYRSLKLVKDDRAVVTADDYRLTRTGQLMRRRHLDELPQLFNILVGNMSLVGPRPMKPEHAASLPPATQALVLGVKPGLTGPDALLFLAEDEALCGYPDAASLYSRYVLPAKADCIRQYLANYSLGLDLAIILRTPHYIVSSKAYAKSREYIRSLLPGPGLAA